MSQLLAQSSPAPAVQPVDDELPYLADGVELIGKYEGSGFRSAPYLVKRRDGQVIQVSELIFLVAAGIDISGDAEEVATHVSARYGREVSADNVRYVVEKKLRPTGLLWSPDDTDDVPAARANPLLALHLRLPLVPERIHRVVTSTLTPLFWPPVVLLAIALVVALDIWLVVGLGSNVIAVAQALIYVPQLLLPLTGLTIAMGLFHEIGHATAARYGGAKPGAMGAGIYLVWPVFYTDVTDSYRLNRRGRLRTDLGGIYFNALFMVAVGAAYLATGHLLFLVFILLAHAETARQFLPFIRLDGYYILSDLAGVPNLFSYMRPALTKAATFWRRGPQPSHRARPLEALTRRTQIVLIVWACVTGPILAFHIVMLVIFLPQIAGAAWGSIGIQSRVLADAIGQAELMAAATAGVGIFFLVLPTAGMSYIAARRLKRVPRLVRRWWEQRPALTAALVTAATLGIVLQVGMVWPQKFTEAASAPGRQLAEARAAESGAEARERVSRGAKAVGDVVQRVAPGMSAPEPEPPTAPPAEPVVTGEGSADDRDQPAGERRTASAQAGTPPGAPAPGAPQSPAAGPAPADPGAAPLPPGSTVPAEQTTTTQPALPTVDELLSSLLPPQ
jgi:putative peptide zinc metalloprotease protein